MADGSAKPVIFISFSHKDEPEKPGPDEVAWLTFVQSFLAPVVKVGIFDIWVDEHLHGGDAIDPVIADKLADCDILVLLVSRHSLASTYVVETEIKTIRQRQKDGDDVHMFPIVLSPTPAVALKPLKDLLLSPKDGQPLSLMSRNDREVAMAKIADDIAEVALEIAVRRADRVLASASLESVLMRSNFALSTPAGPRVSVDIAHLPETAYERLVGREAELKRLDDAWAGRKTNILSLIAEGGAGKSALVNEWLKRMQAENYRGAETVLGWSFYDQGTKERATSAEQFLNWTIEKLGIHSDTTSGSAQGEAIAEALAERRVLLVLDGCEPLQHGLDSQQGELTDLGLRALMRRFASTAPAQAHGLVVLTSRLPVKDIARWSDISAPIELVDKLPEDAGASLLRDNGVWGTDKDLQAAVRDFGGHPLALGLLASFLNETQFGDVRRRDRIRKYFADSENPRYDHAKRVMESYEREWLAGQSTLLSIMRIMGLFDRPASGDCLRALRRKPAIAGLTDTVIVLDDSQWQRSVARLREARLLAPFDPAAPGAIDAHPLVREWFGARLEQENEDGWRAGHSRIYDHLRRTTREGEKPTVESLSPLYQAISHGCRAGRHREVLAKIYIDRICRRTRSGRIEFYARDKLGLLGSDLAACAWFFEKPYDVPVSALPEERRNWVLSDAAGCLRTQARFTEAVTALRGALNIWVAMESWENVALTFANLTQCELLMGNVDTALSSALRAVEYADRNDDQFLNVATLAVHAYALHAAGESDEAERQYLAAERRQGSLLYSVQGSLHCTLLIERGEFAESLSRSSKSIIIARRNNWLVDIALDTLIMGRAHVGLSLVAARDGDPSSLSDNCQAASKLLEEGLDGLRGAGNLHHFPLGFLGRCVLRRSIGNWAGAIRDIQEVEEIAGLGPMKLFLCDVALERARLGFAKIDAFAPLYGLLEAGSPKPKVPDAMEAAHLFEEARQNLVVARKLVEECGYHRRDEELVELEAVLRGERKFADLPPRV